MRRSITLLLIAICISLAGVSWSTPALAGVHAVQGRKKHGRGTKNHHKSSPKPKKEGKKSERGFEL